MSVTLKGPLFNAGRRRAVMERMSYAIAEDVGRHAERAVRANLGRSLRHPTGYYESRIQTDLRGDDARVSDGGVVYGPWLEGTGSRNRTTRFRGYASFRRALQAIDAQAERIAEPHVARACRELS